MTDRVCLCGCQVPISPTARYRPGHDARHAAVVGRRLRTLGAPDEAVLAELPTPALRAKALAMLRSQHQPATAPSPPAGHAREVVDDDPRSTADLLTGYAQTLTVLRRRGVIRSNNAPAGDYGEWLVARALGGTLVANLAGKSYDLVMPTGQRVQVKTRVITLPARRSQLQTSVFRSFDFELAALVLLRDNDYAVHRSVLVPVGVVEQLASRVEHVNGWRLPMTGEVLDHQEAEDITVVTRQAARTE